jgi:hypothetical protein
MRTGVALADGFGNNIFTPTPVQIVLISLHLVVVSCGLLLLPASNLKLRGEAEALALYDPLTHAVSFSTVAASRTAGRRDG